MKLPDKLPKVALLDDNDPGPVPLLAVTVSGAARSLGCGTTTVYEALARGELDGRKLGRKTIITWESVVAYLQRLPKLRGGQAAL
jgi:excisionase family DNA binding protein